MRPAVDHDAGLDRQPGAARQFEIQLDADPHHHQIEGLRIADFAADPCGAVAIFQRDLAAAAQHRDALLAMQFEQRL